MSQENVEIVRRVYAEALLGDDPDVLLDLADDDIQWINPADAVEPGIRRGRDEVLSALANARASFRSAVWEPRDLFDAGDSVVASVTFRARGRDSGIELVDDQVHTWTLRDGKVVRVQWGRDLAAALRAVGLAE